MNIVDLALIGAKKQSACIIKKPSITKKRWGYEEHYVNDAYCMKTLTIYQGQRTSMHFHLDKHETLMPVRGSLIARVKDTETCEIKEYLLHPMEALVIPAGFQHQLCSTGTQVLLIEASTYDNSLDSVRVNL